MKNWLEIKSLLGYDEDLYYKVPDGFNLPVRDWTSQKVIENYPGGQDSASHTVTVVGLNNLGGLVTLTLSKVSPRYTVNEQYWIISHKSLCNSTVLLSLEFLTESGIRSQNILGR